MPLADYQVKTETVLYPGGEFTVRAISLPDIQLLIELHESSISQIVALVQDNKESFGSANETIVQEAVVDFLSALIRESPILVAHLIAILSDEPRAIEQAMRLPITVQLDAVTKIAGLTFTDLASVKKLAEDVMTIVRGIIPPATTRLAA